MIRSLSPRATTVASTAVLLLALWATPAGARLDGLVRVASGLSFPVYATHAPDDASRLFIVEKGGTIRILDLALGSVNATPFLTIPDTDDAGEGGLIGLAFHPDYASNGLFYVHVTVDNGGVIIDGVISPFSSHIREYSVSAGDPDVANATPTEIISWVQPRDNHNAGWIGFGPPGGSTQFLYVMSGDGGKAGDPDNNAQTTVNEPLGKVLRIDVDGDDFPGDPDRNYAIPSGNPLVGQTGDDEIWAYGLRNPWRASFDRESGDLWVGDVGQGAVEEIDFQAAASSGGENYAWNRREGFSPYLGGALLPGDDQPLYDYAHPTDPPEGRSVIGGYVYRGPDPSLRGLYFFGDTISGDFWTFEPAAPWATLRRINSRLVPDVGSVGLPVSFGEDNAGNLYIVDYNGSNGEVFRIETVNAVPALPAWGLAALALALVAGGAYARRSG